MKLVLYVESHADRAMARIDWFGEGLFFAGGDPDEETIIAVELEGLGSASNAAVQKWLTERYGTKSRREVYEIPSELWRPATLDDFIDAKNYERCVWQIPDCFPLEELSAFADRWLPEARSRLRDAVAIEGARARKKALGQLHPFIERVATVFSMSPRHVDEERSSITRELDRARIETLRAGPFDAERWVETARRIGTENLSLELLIEVAKALARTEADPARVHDVLQRVRGSRKLRRLTSYAHEFWVAIRPVLVLPSNVEGETIDLASASEERVELGWDLFEARRIGSVVPGRTALLLRDKAGKATYIRGERKLLFRVERAGGKLDKLGNTFTLSARVGGGMEQAFLQVDRIDTLANVSPRDALREIEDLGIPPDHAVFAAAERALDDPRQARMLADLLIELTIGVDADVARAHARARARGNRR